MPKIRSYCKNTFKENESSHKIPYKKYIFAFILVFVSLLMAEVALHFFYKYLRSSLLVPEKGNAKKLILPYSTPGLSYASQDNFAQMIYHPVLTYRPQFPHRGRGYYINNQGFRYPENFSVKKQDNEIRIFILGGSFSFGAGCPDGYTFFNVMEEQLSYRYPQKHIRVISAGVGAYSSLQEFLYFFTYIYQYEPDIVLIISGWNDVWYGFNGVLPFDGNDRMNYSRAIQGCFNGKIIPREGYKNAFINPEYPPVWDDYNVKLLWLWRALLYLRYKRTNQHEPVPPEIIMKQLQETLRVFNSAATCNSTQLVYVLQPDFYSTQKSFHEHELTLWQQYQQRNPQVQEYFIRSYTNFRKTMIPFFDYLDIPFIDAETGLSSPETAAECFFVDRVHFGERGQKWFESWMSKQVVPFIEESIKQKG